MRFSHSLAAASASVTGALVDGALLVIEEEEEEAVAGTADLRDEEEVPAEIVEPIFVTEEEVTVEGRP